MSRFTGPTRQLGNVVHDIDAAIRYWTQKMGAGPFFIVRRMRFDSFRYRGEPSPSPLVTLAFGQSGPLQIELIQQHDDMPSGYHDFLNSGREGPHHLASWFADQAEYDSAYKALLDGGFAPRHEGTGQGARFSYFSAGEGQYPEAELAEALLPNQGDWFGFIAQSSVGWDGRDPVRLPDGTPESAVPAG